MGPPPALGVNSRPQTPSTSSRCLRTPPLARASEREAAAAQHLPVPPCREGAESGPHEPAIRARPQSVVTTVIRPGARELQPPGRRPGAEDAVSPDEDDVVVAGAADRGPDENRRLGDPLAGSRVEQCPTGDEVERLRRLVGRVIGNRQLVAILAPGPQAAIDEPGRELSAGEDRTLSSALQPRC